MLTVEEARAYLTSLGITLPDFLLQLLVDQANSIEPCLTANYPAGTAKLIGLYLLGLLGISNGDKYVSSESAPSGASRSYRYKALSDSWNSTYNLLRALDTAGCAVPLTPPNPAQQSFAGMWTAKGGCNSCG